MGKLYVVGIGAGKAEGMTLEAVSACRNADVIVGYTAYVELVKAVFPEKEYYSTPMTKETDRCRAALEMASSGKNTVVVCSGDPGVYGMAGLILELSVQFPEVEISIIPGVSAAMSGGALLGAPLMHDFAVISLSDRLTPIELIFQRLHAAAEADFVICLYNPASRGRKDYLRRACECLLEFKPSDTVCGYVRMIGRENETVSITSLGELKEIDADMFTTVWIGNAETIRIGNFMVTKRGYKNV